MRPVTRWTDPDSVGEGDGNSERQSLWNGDDKNGDGYDEEVYEVLDVAVVPRQLRYGELLHAQIDNENDERQNRHRRACIQPTTIQDNFNLLTCDVTVQIGGGWDLTNRASEVGFCPRWGWCVGPDLAWYWILTPPGIVAAEKQPKAWHLNFYRAMHVVQARYCYRMSSVRPSVRPSVRDVDVPWAYRFD